MYTTRGLAMCLTILFTAPLWAHGGTYIGPGDTLPPGGGGGPGPLPPAPPGPTAPPGANPPAPVTPLSPPGRTPPPGVARPVPDSVTGPGALETDLSSWYVWWEFNKGPFLDLRAKLWDGDVISDEGSEITRGLREFSTAARSFAPTTEQVRRVVLPVLLDALAEDERDLRSSALIALARIGGDPGLVERFLPLLASNDQETAETAALALGILRDPAALPQLVALLRDGPEGRRLTGKANGVPQRTRAFAAYGLGLLGTAVADEDLRQHVAQALRQTLDQKVSGPADLAVACALALGLVPLEDFGASQAALLRCLHDEDRPLVARAHCPTGLARLVRGRPDSKEAQAVAVELAAQLGRKNTPAPIRQSCVLALGVLASEPAPCAADVLTALEGVAEGNGDLQERAYATIARAYIGAAVPSLRDRCLEGLLNELRRGSTPLRPWCALALGVLGFRLRENEQALPPVLGDELLRQFRETRNPDLKAACALSLGLLHHAAAADDLHAAMEKSGDDGFRSCAAQALGLLDARQHRGSLLALLQESARRPQLLRSAAIALGLMQDRQAAPALVAMIRPPDGNAPALATMAAAAMALGFIGDTGSVAPLAETIRDHERTPLARAFAAVALGLVCERGDLPWNSELAADVNYAAAVGTLTDPAGGSGILDIF